MAKSAISVILKRLMFEQGIKSMELARRSGLPQPTVHRIVAGECQNPHQTSLATLANYFNISVAQLKGLEAITGLTPQELYQLKQVPLIPLDQATTHSLGKISAPVDTLFTTNNLSRCSFAVALEDTSMQPLFPANTQVLIDPGKKLSNRGYVLAAMHDEPLPIFRQLIIEKESYYLKPLNPDTALFKIHLLRDHDHVLGSLVEARYNYDI